MAKTVTDEIADARTRNEVYLLRYARHSYKRQAELIDLATADLINKLLSRAPGDNSFTAQRLNLMIEAIKKRGGDLYKALEGMTVEDLAELAAYEAEATAGAIAAAYPVAMVVADVPPSKVLAAARARPFQGRLLRDWYRDQDIAIRKQMESAIRIGYIEGETLPQVAGRIRSIADLEKRQAETIARTAIKHTSNVAMQQTTQANADLFAAEEWVSTLDGRTSSICQARDGKRYAIGSGPYPPAHFNCRSSRVPVTKSWKELGFDGLDDDEPLSSRPFVADKRSVKDIPKADRDKIIGQTTAKSYNDWLRTQPREFVNDVLGPSRAKLYLDGGISLDRFVDRKGSTLTLDQIRQRNKRAFEKANL